MGEGFRPLSGLLLLRGAGSQEGLVRSFSASRAVCLAYRLRNGAEAVKTYPRPEGESPRGRVCPLCGAGPHTAHEADCPWLLWAKYPEKKAKT
jgi:hypothetical protein